MQNLVLYSSGTQTLRTQLNLTTPKKGGYDRMCTNIKMLTHKRCQNPMKEEQLVASLGPITFTRRPGLLGSSSRKDMHFFSGGYTEDISCSKSWIALLTFIFSSSVKVSLTNSYLGKPSYKKNGKKSRQCPLWATPPLNG